MTDSDDATDVPKVQEVDSVPSGSQLTSGDLSARDQSATQISRAPANSRLHVAGDLLPFVLSAVFAWWSTVRPSGFGPTATWHARTAAIGALVGIGLSAFAMVRRLPRFAPVAIGAFVVPCAFAWLLGPDQATSLSEPIELLVGAIAWTALGILLIRPQTVAEPATSVGDAPTLGANDDETKIVARSWDDENKPQTFLPRQKLPRLASLPLYVGLAIAGVVAFMTFRLASVSPDRAVLARVAAAAVVIAVLGTAGDLVEVRYMSRKAVRPQRRISRAALALVASVLLVVAGSLLLSRDQPGFTTAPREK